VARVSGIVAELPAARCETTMAPTPKVPR